MSTAARPSLAAHGLPDTADNRVAAMTQATREAVEESVQTLRRCQKPSRAAQRDWEAAIVATRRDRQEMEAVGAESRRARRRLDSTRSQLASCRHDVNRMRQRQAAVRDLAVQTTEYRTELQQWQATLARCEQAIEAAEERIRTMSSDAATGPWSNPTTPDGRRALPRAAGHPLTWIWCCSSWPGCDRSPSVDSQLRPVSPDMLSYVVDMKRLPNGVQLEPGEVAELANAARAAVSTGPPTHPRDLYLAAVALALEDLVGGPDAAPPAFLIAPVDTLTAPAVPVANPQRAARHHGRRSSA